MESRICNPSIQEPLITQQHVKSTDLVSQPRISHLEPSRGPDEGVERWLVASKVLSRQPKGCRLSELEDCLSEDIPIRAVLYGWGALGGIQELSPFWRILRYLDEVCWGGYDRDCVERLAVLRLSHLLMRFFSDRSDKRAADLPPFYHPE
jgi:hypothetical protein